MTEPRSAYKTELDPNQTQRCAFEQHGGAARYVWNRTLALQIAQTDKMWAWGYKRSQVLRHRLRDFPRVCPQRNLLRRIIKGLVDATWRKPTSRPASKAGSTSLFTPAQVNLMITEWKNESATPWLYEVANHALQEVPREVLAAYKSFFEKQAKLAAGDAATVTAKEEARPRKDGKPYGFPRFRAKHRWSPSFTLRGTFRVERDRVRLPKIGWVRLKEHGYLPTDRTVKSATISRRAGRWFVSLLVDEDPTHLQGVNGLVIGIDFGLNAWATASDGRIWQRPKKLAALDRKLTHAQRKLARQQKGSNSWTATKAHIARLHWQIANARENALHEMTSKILGANGPPSQRPRAVVIEDLAVKNMLQNHSLARAIGDAAWGEFRRQLEYKADWQGTEVIVADRFFPSSQLCSACGHQQKMPLELRVFKCEACGAEFDRDLNASLTLREYGLWHLAGKASERLNGGGGWPVRAADETPISFGCSPEAERPQALLARG